MSIFTDKFEEARFAQALTSAANAFAKYWELKTEVLEKERGVTADE